MRPRASSRRSGCAPSALSALLLLAAAGVLGGTSPASAGDDEPGREIPGDPAPNPGHPVLTAQEVRRVLEMEDPFTPGIYARTDDPDAKWHRHPSYQALVSIGARAVPGLVSLLGGGDDFMAYRAAVVLAGLGEAAAGAGAELKRVAESSRRISTVRACLTALVVVDPDPTAVAAYLVDLLRQPARADARSAILLALSRLGPHARSALPDVLASLEAHPEGPPPLTLSRKRGTWDMDVWQASMALLTALGPEAREASSLLRDMWRATPDAGIGIALRAVDPQQFLDAMFETLGSATDGSRAWQATLLLRSSDPLAEEIRARLVGGESSPSVHLRRAIPILLWRMPSPGAVDARILLHLMKDPDAQVRASAIATIWGRGLGDAEVLPATVALCADPDDDVRATAVARVGGESWDPGIASLVLRGLEDQAPRVVFAAAQRLGARGLYPTQVARWLIDVARREAESRAFALLLLGEHGWLDRAVLEFLLASLLDPEPRVRQRALGALALLACGVPRARHAVTLALGDASPRVSQTAEKSLPWM